MTFASVYMYADANVIKLNLVFQSKRYTMCVCMLVPTALLLQNRCDVENIVVVSVI